MNSPYCLQVTLKQHTPLMVSQEEPWVYLRPTELKPALAQFLLKHAKADEVKESWILKATKEGEKTSLDFSVRNFTYKQIKKVEFETDRDGEIRKKRNGQKIGLTWINSPVFHYCFTKPKIEIHSKKIGLLDFIRKHLEAFFICHNFGRAKSKGYGQFTCVQIDDEKIHFSKTKVEKYFRDYMPIERQDDFKPIYHRTKGQFITRPQDFYEFVYVFLKSGKNFDHIDIRERQDVLEPSDYPKADRIEFEKSLLWKYINEKLGINWSKKKIKYEIYQSDENHVLFDRLKIKDENRNKYIEGIDFSKEEEFLFYRAVLGLSENYEFILENPRGKLPVKVEDEAGEIQQFPSPLHLRILDSHCYMIPTRMEDVFNRNFRFEFKNPLNSEPTKFDVKTPANFSLIDFLDYQLKDENVPIHELLGFTKI